MEEKNLENVVISQKERIKTIKQEKQNQRENLERILVRNFKHLVYYLV